MKKDMFGISIYLVLGGEKNTIVEINAYFGNTAIKWLEFNHVSEYKVNSKP